jgi:Ca-activated chloride channel homolog
MHKRRIRRSLGGLGLGMTLAIALALGLALALVGGCKKQDEAKRSGATPAADSKKSRMSAAAPEAQRAEDRTAMTARAPSKASRGRARRGASRQPLSGLFSTMGANRPRPAPATAAGGVPARRFADLRVVAGRKIPHMYFKHWGVNPTIDTEEAHLSTFGADVDTASFALARGYLRRNVMPPEAAIRVEEFINAFDYGYKPPRGKHPVKVHLEVLPSPNRRGYHVLRIGVAGRAVTKARRKPAHLVFVIDASATMARQRRLHLVQRSLRLLVRQLKRTDRVAIVAFDTSARVILPATAGHLKAKILRAVNKLKAQGATNAQAGLELGFRLAAQGSGRHVKRVILCSDGVANNGVTSAEAVLKAVKKYVARGVTLSAVGFGMGYYNDRLMEQLARGSNGNYHYVDRLSQAKRIFVERLTSTLQVVARDVKLQVSFDKRAVSRYRLLGYESSMVKGRAFRKRRTPAGELGAGESVTALYEVKLKPSGARRSLGQVRVRYKRPGSLAEQRLSTPLPRASGRRSFAKGSAGTQLAVVVASFAEKLRGSYWARNISYARILTRLKAIPASASMTTRADVLALRDLIQRAARLDKRGDKFAQHLPLSRMTFDRVPVLR